MANWKEYPNLGGDRVVVDLDKAVAFREEIAGFTILAFGAGYDVTVEADLSDVLVHAGIRQGSKSDDF